MSFTSNQIHNLLKSLDSVITIDRFVKISELKEQIENGGESKFKMILFRIIDSQFPEKTYYIDDFLSKLAISLVSNVINLRVPLIAKKSFQSSFQS